MFQKGSDRHWIATSTMAEGRSLNLGKGQFAIVDKKAVPTNDGLKVISDFKGLPKTNTFQLVLGTAGLAVNRSQDNKSYKSLDFKISDIEELRVSAPKQGIKVDKQLLGYDGFDAATAISLQPGDTEEISLTLHGPALGLVGYSNDEITIKEALIAPNGDKAADAAGVTAGQWTDQEIVEKAVESLKKTTVMGGVPLSDFVDITVVNSENPSTAPGDDAVFYNLVVDDKGTHSDLGLVKSQTPGYEVKVTDQGAEGTTYTAVVKKETITAGSFVVGQAYVINTPGTTDFTAIGAADSVAGTKFTATGVGAGTGTADVIPVTSFVKNKAWLVKGCADCPAGYSELEDGFVYSVSIEDDNADSTATVEAISANATAGSAVKVGEEAGFSTYTFVNSAELTDAEKDAFIATHAEAIIELVSRDVSEVCSPDNSTTYEWVEGKTCKVSTESYSIVVPHDECGTAPTAEIGAYYTELTIATGASAYCQTTYTTTVVTNIACEDCDPAFREIFTSKAPENFGVHYWTKAGKVYDADALMGILFEGKKIIFAGSEEYRDQLPEIATSTKLRVAGGYAGTITESFNEGSTGGRYSVKILSVASEPENWGMNLRDWEESGHVYFSGEGRYINDNYANFVLGKETNLAAAQPYVDYILKVRIKTRTQAFYEEKNETLEYHIVVEPGRHQAVEDVLNAIAAEAGVATVQAFGKTSA